MKINKINIFKVVDADHCEKLNPLFVLRDRPGDSSLQKDCGVVIFTVKPLTLKMTTAQVVKMSVTNKISVSYNGIFSNYSYRCFFLQLQQSIIQIAALEICNDTRKKRYKKIQPNANVLLYIRVCAALRVWFSSCFRLKQGMVFIFLVWNTA